MLKKRTRFPRLTLLTSVMLALVLALVLIVDSAVTAQQSPSVVTNPVTGPQQINIDPNGKLVSVVAYSQAAGQLGVQIVDSNNQVVFNANRNSPDGTFTLLGAGTFNSGGNGTYTVTFSADSQVQILRSENTTEFNNRRYLQQYTFITNDFAGIDSDFNDIYLNIAVFDSQG